MQIDEAIRVLQTTLRIDETQVAHSFIVRR
jgi:hypothetical protein